MILGFAGKAATGKTTAANHIAPLLDKECRIVPMAMVLRDEVEAFLRAVGADESVPLVYGCQDDKVRVFYVDEKQTLVHCQKWSHFISEHEEIQDKPGQTAVTVRRILQWWGTEYRRDQDPDYWTKAWGRKIEQFEKDTLLYFDEVKPLFRGKAGALIEAACREEKRHIQQLLERRELMRGVAEQSL